MPEETTGSSTTPEPLRFRGPDEVARFVRRCDDGTTTGALVFGLDPRLQLTGAAVGNEHGSLVTIEPEHLVMLSDELAAWGLVLVLLRPAQTSPPSAFEAHHLTVLIRQCSEAGVTLLDGLVVAGHRWWSLREHAGSGQRESRARRSDL